MQDHAQRYERAPRTGVSTWLVFLCVGTQAQQAVLGEMANHIIYIYIYIYIYIVEDWGIWTYIMIFGLTLNGNELILSGIEFRFRAFGHTLGYLDLDLGALNLYLGNLDLYLGCLSCSRTFFRRRIPSRCRILSCCRIFSCCWFLSCCRILSCLRILSCCRTLFCHRILSCHRVL